MGRTASGVGSVGVEGWKDCLLGSVQWGWLYGRFIKILGAD